jgi:hypothetical protein
MRAAIFLCTVVALAACAATASPPAPINVTAPSAAASSASAATTTTSAMAAAPASSSAAVLRQAKLAGYYTRKLPQGTTVFCKAEAHLGSRFSTESCIDEPQLAEFLIRAQDQRDRLTNRRGTGTDVH